MSLLKKLLPLTACVAVMGCVDSEVSSEDFDSVSSDVSSNTGTLDSVTTTANQNSDRLFLLESDMDDLQEAMTALSEEYDVLESRYNAQEIRVNAVLSQITNNADAIDALEDAQIAFATIAAVNLSQSTLLENFPDAIEIGSASTDRQVFYILNSGEHTGNVTYWHPAAVGAAELNTITFDSSGGYVACTGSGCNGADTTIANLTALGDSFNFVQDNIE